MLLSEEELRFQAIPDPTREQLIEAGYIEISPETGLDSRVRKDPTAAEWARWLGYDTSYELPVPSGNGGAQPKHQDKAIQTLMFPSEMEVRLRGLRNKAETAIEETGANVCHVAFGFLEWFESLDSDQPRHAPLLPIVSRFFTSNSQETGRGGFDVLLGSRPKAPLTGLGHFWYTPLQGNTRTSHQGPSARRVPAGRVNVANHHKAHRTGGFIQ